MIPFNVPPELVAVNVDVEPWHKVPGDLVRVTTGDGVTVTIMEEVMAPHAAAIAVGVTIY